MRALGVKFFYRDDCPYCKRFMNKVLIPLENMQLVKVKWIHTRLEKSGPDIARARRFSEIIGSSEVEVPLLIDAKNENYFAPWGEKKEEDVEGAIAEMAENFIEYLCTTLNISPKKIFKDKYGPLIIEALEGSK